jgi:uncharacterized protein (DUF2236 family)
MLDLLVGGRRDMQRAAGRINAIHDRVHGIAPESDTVYSAHDPGLLAWVHIALHATLLDAYHALVGSLSVEDQDEYCREVASIEPLLGIPDGLLPRDAGGLRREFHARLPGLRVGDNARRIASGILRPRLPRWLPPITGLARLCTVGFLPICVRRAYGLVWTRARQRLFQVSVRAVRGALPLVPRQLRFVPPRLMLRWSAYAEE